eukprot:gene8024-5579_t
MRRPVCRADHNRRRTELTSENKPENRQWWWCNPLVIGSLSTPSTLTEVRHRFALRSSHLYINKLIGITVLVSVWAFFAFCKCKRNNNNNNKNK